MRMKCMFVVGQRVVCVKKGNWVGLRQNTLYDDDKKPEAGSVYTISGVTVAQETVCVALCGFNSLYTANRFRPLAEPDISVFKTLLADINAGKVKPVVVPA